MFCCSFAEMYKPVLPIATHVCVRGLSVVIQLSVTFDR